ncbi:AraC family transcriptional regulator [Symbioplanes lichenis]|uniref:AraC family transcriptional regulator n=1 Tax=Symbioplanes lichenis TaxID=1629072 RepID=UPI00273948C6|nr:AraC family transcriptional regulator [Actinoplanes lichenis]
MTEPPVGERRGLLYFSDGSVAYAGHYLHEDVHPDHTHSFVEIAVMIDGAGVHRSMAGRHRMSVGDVVLLRPGVWHGYEQCRGLRLYNCCFSVDLLHGELAWTREDPLLGYLLWTGPYAAQRRGMLTATLGADDLARCVTHLDALDRLRGAPADRYRGDIIGHLSLFLATLARAVGPSPARAHPAVTSAMRLLEADPARRWTLTELADSLHLTSSYLVRLFKATTGLPPMAYLARHRVETAASLLLHTDEPITHIARSVGWPDQNYFARRFRAHFGLSASAYRTRFAHRTVRVPALHDGSPPR